jgi:hypothetical protein
MRHYLRPRRRSLAAIFSVLFLLPLAALSGCGSGAGTAVNPDPSAKRAQVSGIVLMHEEGTPRTRAGDRKVSRLVGALPGYPLHGATITVRKLDCAGPGPLDACRATGEVTRFTSPGSLFDIWLPPGKYSFKGLPADPAKYDGQLKIWAQQSKPISTDVVVGEEGISIYVFYDYPPQPPAPPVI